MGDWKPDDEIDEDEDRIGRSILSREELLNIAMRFITLYIQQKVENPVDKGWTDAIKLQKNLDKERPIAELKNE